MRSSPLGQFNGLASLVRTEAGHHDIASPGPVDEEEAAGDQSDRHGESRGQRLVQDQVAGGDAEQGVRKVNADSRAAE